MRRARVAAGIVVATTTTLPWLAADAFGLSLAGSTVSRAAKRTKSSVRSRSGLESKTGHCFPRATRCFFVVAPNEGSYHRYQHTGPPRRRRARGGDEDSRDEKYSNPVVAFLGNFLPRTGDTPTRPVKDDDDETTVDWDVPKAKNLPVETLAARLEAALREREWFVTGRVAPEFFADDFRFVDPDVRIDGLRNYADGVRRLFDASSRAQIVACEVDKRRETDANTLPDGVAAIVLVTWRLSGRVNLGPLPGGLRIKPYLVYTDLHVRAEDGLICFQEDRFSIPGWDILLSALAPWLPFLAPPAPEVADLAVPDS